MVARPFYVELAAGSWLGHLNKVWQLLGSVRALEFMGLRTQHESPLAQTSQTSSEIALAMSDSSANTIVKYAFNLVYFRMRRLLQYSFGFPYCWASLLDFDDDAKRRCLRWTKRVLEATQKAATVENAFVGNAWQVEFKVGCEPADVRFRRGCLAARGV